jgi:hypothetical protein
MFNAIAAAYAPKRTPGNCMDYNHLSLGLAPASDHIHTTVNTSNRVAQEYLMQGGVIAFEIVGGPDNYAFFDHKTMTVEEASGLCAEFVKLVRICKQFDEIENLFSNMTL